MSTPVALLLAALLIAGNGFFVGVEFALLAARQTKLAGLAETSRRARSALRAAQQLPLMISGCQFGITICSLGLGAVAEPAVAALLEPVFAAVHLPEAVLHPLAFALALLATSVLHMLLGEMVPKNIALAGPERAAMLLAPPLLGFIRIFRPAIVALTAAATAVLGLFGVAPVDEGGHVYTADQVAGLVDEARREGLLGREEHEHVVDALAFGERTARAVLLPRERLVTVPETVTAGQVEQRVAETGFSRFPVAAGDGRLVGYVHLADVLHVPLARRNRPLPAGAVRPLPTVAAGIPLHEALSLLQRTGAHLAEVVDGGRPLGVVALEDVLEELVGEVRDATRRSGRR
ncbi:hemolysin family protein [Geodermatophilus sp. URMC 64]